MTLPPTPPTTGATVLVVDHVRVSREHLLAVLRHEPAVLDAVGAARPTEAARLLQERRFGVVLVSMTSAENRTMCRSLVEMADPTPLVACALSPCYDEVVCCAEAGVAGYVLCDEGQAELVEAVLAAVRGDLRCPPAVAAILMRRMSPRGATSQGPVGDGRLTVREREILHLIDRGMSNKEIARALGIEVRTVKNHVHNLLEKLEVHRRGDAAALLRRHPVHHHAGPRVADGWTSGTR